MNRRFLNITYLGVIYLFELSLTTPRKGRRWYYIYYSEEYYTKVSYILLFGAISFIFGKHETKT